MSEAAKPLDPELIRRLELAEAFGTAECAMAWAEAHAESPLVAAEIGGGAWVMCGDPQSPLCRAIGLGLDGSIEESVLDRVEELFAEHGHSPKVDVTSVADAGLVEVLRGRGYEPIRTMHVFSRSLGPKDLFRAEGDHTPAEGMAISTVDKEDEEEMLRLATAVASAYEEGNQPGEVGLLVMRQLLSQPSVTPFAAYLGGEIAGGGCVATYDGVCALYGAAVLPQFRERGVQTALIKGRLMWSRPSNADVALIQCRPGVATGRNAERFGFTLAYAKEEWGKRE